MRRHASTTAEVVSFSAGALLGAGLAFLYAPRTGHETREKVSEVTGNAITRMKDIAADAQEQLNRNLRKGRDYAEEKASELSSTVEETTEQYHH